MRSNGCQEGMLVKVTSWPNLDDKVLEGYAN